MAVEIERKFLLADARWRAEVTSSERLSQGYLGGDACSARVRVAGERAWLNIKSRVAGSTRLEFEYAIPLADAEHMLAAFCPGRVEKVRHLVPAGPYTWEIDEFLGENAGLVVAEIELDRADADFARPAWLGREVTDETRYYNLNLAREPFSRWPDRQALMGRE